MDVVNTLSNNDKTHVVQLGFKGCGACLNGGRTVMGRVNNAGESFTFTKFDITEESFNLGELNIPQDSVSPQYVVIRDGVVINYGNNVEEVYKYFNVQEKNSKPIGASSGNSSTSDHINSR